MSRRLGLGMLVAVAGALGGRVASAAPGGPAARIPVDSGLPLPGGPAGAVDAGLGKLLAAEQRPADAVLRVAVASRRVAGGAGRAVALASEWERPALLAAEVDGRWSSVGIGRNVDVTSLELRDLTGDGAPEVLARLVTRVRRTEHEVTLTHFVIYQVGPRGFGVGPVFDELERVEEAALPGHIGALSGGATFSIEIVRGRGKAAAAAGVSEILVSLVRDRLDDEHEAFQRRGTPRRPGTLAGRFVWDGKRFVRRALPARS
ncbi:MAG: hypothetical protein IT370_04740 [Deltaproteobacteria bacterium]|nr:hypothetical protein [Deltaproteobacteria bacterium]